MSDWNFSELGRQIGKTVDDVLNSKEVKDLQNNIKNTVNHSMETVRESVTDAVTGAADTVNKSVKWDKTPRPPKPPRPPMPVTKQLPAVRTPEENIAGTIMVVLGSIGGTMFGIASLACLAVGIFGMSMEAFIAGVVLAIPSAICSAVTNGGRGIKKRVRRFKIYRKALEPNGFCSIRELADKVRKKESFVVKDLTKMMKDRWFLEGHLDRQNTCFMITDEAYEQYCQAEDSRRIREREEFVSKEKEEEKKPSSEVDDTVSEGKRYIREIRKANDDIPGEEISKKLDRLELVTSKIFDYVENHPEKLPDIRRFMDYYLPTTMKLIYKYREFDNQPVQGENIRKGKQEIEATLDNINASFERLFDQLFQEEMLDVSTDISVLSTMLAQAGLSGNDFEKKI